MSKRIKTSEVSTPKLLRPFRKVGVVTNAVPSAIASLGDTYTVSTVVGRSVQIYDAASLRLLFLTQPYTAANIDCIAAHFHHVFVAAGQKLYVYRRGHLDAEADIPNTGKSARAQKIVVFGEYICVITPQNVVVFKWNPKETQLTLYTSITLPSLLGKVVDAAHPATYLNKLIVATQSSLVLVNVKTGKTVHVFAEQPEGIANIEVAPHVLDVVACASPNGTVTLQNLRTGKVLFNLQTGEPITSMSFRSDGVQLLSLATANGDVFFYDLDTKKRVQSLRNFEKSHTSSVAFLPGQPVLVVSGSNNELSEYVFDPPLTVNGGHRARLLRRRGGHSAAPSCILFDEETHFVISGALDGSMWMFSLRKDSQSRKFGNSKIDKRLSGGVTCMAYSPRKEWPTLLTVNSGEKEAFTWDAVKGSFGAVTLPTPDGSLVKQVAVSNCGNFGLIGSSAGRIVAYNLQSGLKRLDAPGAHTSAITGLDMSPNNAVVFSTSLDGSVRATEFQTGKEMSRLDLGMGAITGMRYHAASRLLACATDDMSLVVIDTTTMRIVRELLGHGNRITSFDFIPSGRWLLSASLDGTIRTWDIPSGGCINGIRIENPATVLRISYNGEYVATSHVQGLGVQMWVLNTLTGNLRTMREEEFPVEGIISSKDDPNSGSNGADDGQFEVSVEDVNYEEDNMQGFVSSIHDANAQLGGKTTLSSEPRNKFTTLVHLDAIRERNKPVEGVKKPEKMPFFLGSADSNGKADGSEQDGENGSHLTNMASAPVASYATPFTDLLNRGDLDGIVAHMAGLGPAATDLEIRSLDTTSPYSELIAFIDAMTAQTTKGTMFELVQAWMKMLLDAHRDLFAEEVLEDAEQLRESFSKWLNAEESAVNNMNEHIRYCLGVMSFLK